MAGTQNVGESSDNPVAINITAMVDVIFCLCLFFMCSFKFKQLEGKIETWLPKDKGINPEPTLELTREEVRVVLRWDPTTEGTTRRVLNYEIAGSDEDLMQTVTTLAEGYNSAGNTTWPLVIDSTPEVPWTDVVHVMDLCKQQRVERIEFGAPETPIDATE